MHEIIVVGPIDGQYILGYFSEGSGTLYIIHKFFSKEFANLTAWRMNSNRQKGIA